MIKIDSHLRVADPAAYVKTLVERHWRHFNPVDDGGKYTAKSAIEACRRLRQATGQTAPITSRGKHKGATYLQYYADGDSAKLRRQQDFLDYLLHNDGANLVQLYTARPDTLAAMATAIGALTKSGDFFKTDKGKLKQTEFGKRLSRDVFDYASFRSSQYCADLYRQLQFNQATCPYCNHSVLEIVQLHKGKDEAPMLKAYFQLDHYFAQVRHPYLALSFFNLIPSCGNCNAVDKLDAEFALHTHVHPFHEAFDDFYHFELSMRGMWGMVHEVQIVPRQSTTHRDGGVDAFRLRDKYAGYSALAIDLHRRFVAYEHCLKTEDAQTLRLFQDAVLHGMSLDKRDILRTNRGKMKRDLIRQFDVANALKID
ncbi:hypothetical protein [Duganella callida]|uniref:Uncharacterized protein n=1 Tax=Duganella callida TaxID=2561932 RepID=A0A4Y9T0N0_9BURK|nr:hypothetical protein [Duganella callida]TFW31401.1 hypothetical protein E4L98_00480 [Duganella callida]